MNRNKIQVMELDKALGELNPVSLSMLKPSTIKFNDEMVGSHEVVTDEDYVLLCPLLVEVGCFDKSPLDVDRVYSFLGRRFEGMEPDDLSMERWTDVGNFVERPYHTIYNYLVN